MSEISSLFTDLVAMLDAYQAFFYLLVIACSAMVGSFLNVVIFRMPLKQFWLFRQQAHETLDLLFDEEIPRKAAAIRSHCPSCSALIAWYDNVPVVSYVFLRGKCRQCHSSISVQYPIVEAITVALMAIAAAHLGPSVLLLTAFVWTGYLITMAMIDAQTTYIFDALALPFLWIGLLLSASGVLVSPAHSIAGAAIGFAVPWGFTRAYAKLRGLDFVMGGGDLKLLAAIGAWCGPIAPVLTLGFGAMLFLLWHGFGYLRGRDITLQTQLPLGPFLAIAAWPLFIFANALPRWP